MYRYTEKKVKRVNKSAMNLILSFVGKAPVPKMCRVCDPTSFGAEFS